MELSFDFAANILRNMMADFYFVHEKIIEEIVNNQGISINQFYILQILSKNEGKSTKELADILKISQPAVTQFINKLVDLNYLSKENHPKDKRRTMYHLTKMGQEKLEILQNKQIDIVKNVIENMDRGKDLLLIEGLKAFMDSWNKRNISE